VRLKRPIENRAYLGVPKCTPDSLEISVIKIESLKGLNQLKPRPKKYYNYSYYTSITYTTLGHFYRPNRWHSAGFLQGGKGRQNIRGHSMEVLPFGLE
jgi:hypothetical protein